MEISLNIETEVFVKFTFLWPSLELADIDDLPLLVDLSMFLPDNYVSVFIIETTRDIHDFSVLLINEIWSLPFEELEPS
jgi:hypothetical protein